MMFVSAVVVAGGSGIRMGSAVPKPFVRICGVPMVFYSLQALETGIRACYFTNRHLVIMAPLYTKNWRQTRSGRFGTRIDAKSETA